MFLTSMIASTVSGLSNLRRKELSLQPLERKDGKRRHGNDRTDRGEHLGIACHRTMIRNQIADACRGNHQLSDNDADESHSKPQSESGEDEAGGVRKNNFDQ